VYESVGEVADRLWGKVAGEVMVDNIAGHGVGEVPGEVCAFKQNVDLHSATDTHDMEEAVREVCDAEVAKLLRLVANVVILHAESASDGNMFEDRSDECRDAEWESLRDECCGGHLRVRNTLGFDLGHIEEVLLRITPELLVHRVADSGEQDQTQEGACY